MTVAALYSLRRWLSTVPEVTDLLSAFMGVSTMSESLSVYP